MVDTVPSPEQILDARGWKELMAERHGPLLFEVDDSATFTASEHHAEVGGIDITEISSVPHRVEAAERNIYAGPPTYLLQLQIEGVSQISQSGRVARLGPGGMVAYDPALPCVCTYETDFRIVVASIPQHLIALPPRALADLTATSIPTSGMGGLVGALLNRMAADLRALSTSPSGMVAARSLQEMLTAALEEALGSGRPAASVARMTELAAIRNWISERLGEPLTLERIASAHFISVRKLQGLFGAQGVTVMDWVRSRRLEMARRDLATPLDEEETVREVGARWGFSDPSYFAQAFRAAYGVTPRTYRANHSA